jgi:hypothetical protein
MESRAGGACALGEVGWTFRSVVSYNVTKCDMRRSMCHSAVSVGPCREIDRLDMPAAANKFGRGLTIKVQAATPPDSWSASACR